MKNNLKLLIVIYNSDKGKSFKGILVPKDSIIEVGNTIIIDNLYQGNVVNIIEEPNDFRYVDLTTGEINDEFRQSNTRIMKAVVTEFKHLIRILK